MSGVDGDQAIRLLDIAEWSGQQEVWQEARKHGTVMAEEGELSIHRLDTHQVIPICSNTVQPENAAAISLTS